MTYASQLLSHSRKLLNASNLLRRDHAVRWFTKEPSWNFLSSAKSFLGQDDLHRRNINRHAYHTNQVDELAVVKHETDRSDQVSDNSLFLANNNVNNLSNVKYSAMSNLKPSSKHDLAMVFTCKVCETRSVKTCCRDSYERGVVLARCPGCDNLHLMADRLGLFGEPESIEDLLASRGEAVKKGLDTLSLSLEDLAGIKS